MVSDRKAPIMSTSVTLGSSLHYWKKRRMYPWRVSSSLLAIVLEVPWVLRALVCALEVPHKDLLQIRPTLDRVGR